MLAALEELEPPPLLLPRSRQTRLDLIKKRSKEISIRWFRRPFICLGHFPFYNHRGGRTLAAEGSGVAGSGKTGIVFVEEFLAAFRALAFKWHGNK